MDPLLQQARHLSRKEAHQEHKVPPSNSSSKAHPLLVDSSTALQEDDRDPRRSSEDSSSKAHPHSLAVSSSHLRHHREEQHRTWLRTVMLARTQGLLLPELPVPMEPQARQVRMVSLNKVDIRHLSSKRSRPHSSLSSELIRPRFLGPLCQRNGYSMWRGGTL